MIIDVHAHTSNHRLWGLHQSSATIDDLVKLAEQFGISKIILLATYFPFKGSGLVNQELLDRVKGKKLFAVMASLDVMTNLNDGLIELSVLADRHQIVGLKIYPGYQIFHPSAELAFPIYDLAKEFNLPVMVHTGELHHCCPKEQRQSGNLRCGEYCKIDKFGHLAEPRSLAKAIAAFPSVKFILSHLGNPFFEQLRHLMRQHPNVYTDISGQYVSGTAEDTPAYRTLLKKELTEFLKIDQVLDRILFGTDFPIQSHADSIALVESLDLNQAGKEKIFWRNAQKLFNFQV